MTIVYRVYHGVYEIGEIDLEVPNTNRTGIPNWCHRRIAVTWNEGTALKIVKALQDVENNKVKTLNG
jgi:hypothetical protein